MLTVEEAQRRVLAEVRVIGTERVPLPDALGRILREDVVAPHDVPAADNSAMDGYAVRAEDIAGAPRSLRVIDDVAAGHLSAKQVEPGTAIRIMTGALLPEGADTVVQVELTDGGTDIVEVREALPRGANVRSRGEDMRAGALLVGRGTPLHAAELGVLATAQRAVVEVARRPVVAILSTGDELVEIDEPRAFGKVVNSNAYALAALVTEAGGIPLRLPIVRDTREATVAAFASALEADFIVSSGGVSVGAYDFVKDALQELGAETLFWKVAMKPGKPVVFSRLRERLCFGLPGNPVSSMVSFLLFVLPALRKCMGQERNVFPPTVHARVTAALKGAPDRRVYARVRVIAREGELLAEPMRAQGSGVSTSMLQANGLAMLEASVEGGATVAVLLVGAVVAE
ncbi:MAG TPA: gephyrin-like molybdotransferase Glp [Thermoanaerobaculia bacterium]